MQWLIERIHRIDLLPFFLWPHRKLIVIEIFDPQTRKLKCLTCGRYFAMSDRQQAVLPWDEEFEQITRLIYGVPRTRR